MAAARRTSRWHRGAVAIAAVLLPVVLHAEYDPLRPLAQDEIRGPAEGPQFFTGHQLLARCGSDESQAQACTDYLLGVMDGLEVAYDALGAAQGTCVPDWLHDNPGKVRSLIVKYLKAHQDELDSGAGYVVADALQQLFPCPGRKP